MIPFLPDWRLWGGTGGRGQGPSTAVCVTGSRLWKGLFWLRRADMFQTGLSPHRGEKNAPGARFFWEKREDARNWVAQIPSIQIPLDVINRIQLLWAVSTYCVPDIVPDALLVLLLIFTSSLRSLLLLDYYVLFYRKGNWFTEGVRNVAMVAQRVKGRAAMLSQVFLSSFFNASRFSETSSTLSSSPQTTLG